MGFKEFISEELKIVKKNWKLEIDDYTVEVNDKLDHDLLNRIYSRTNLKTNQFNEKLQKGLDYINSKLKKGKITKDIMIGINYTKSEFIVLFLVKPDSKYIRVSTVLDKDMIVKGSIKWDLNEFNDFNNTKIDYNINESGPDLNYSILVEPWEGKQEVHFNFSDCFELEL